MNLHFFTSIHTQLGIMTWPLTLLSALMLMLIIERFVVTLLNTNTRSKGLEQEIYKVPLDNETEIEHYLSRHQKTQNTLAQGLCMLIRHREFTKAMREEAVSIWLQKKRRQYTSGLKLLNVIGALSPLLGLLGTVLGLIEMFKGLSTAQGGVSPAELSHGLGLAMSTTAAGLLIALPAIAVSQLGKLWADTTLAKIEYVLNHFNLHLSGLSPLRDNLVCCAKNPPPSCASSPCSSRTHQEGMETKTSTKTPLVMEGRV